MKIREYPLSPTPSPPAFPALPVLPVLPTPPTPLPVSPLPLPPYFTCPSRSPKNSVSRRSSRAATILRHSPASVPRSRRSCRRRHRRPILLILLSPGAVPAPLQLREHRTAPTARPTSLTATGGGRIGVMGRGGRTGEKVVPGSLQGGKDRREGGPGRGRERGLMQRGASGSGGGGRGGGTASRAKVGGGVGLLVA